MSSGKSPSVAQADKLAELRCGLAASDSVAVEACCGALGVPAPERERFAVQARFALQRANERLPAATEEEVALALGVLVALYSPAPGSAELG